MTAPPQASHGLPASPQAAPVEQPSITPVTASPDRASSVEQPSPVEQTECSRAGCREQAVWALRWRNPRIHAADRRKTWIACDEHVVYLREFLSARDFPVEVAALAQRLA